jgi:hypothetical protein
VHEQGSSYINAAQRKKFTRGDRDRVLKDRVAVLANGRSKLKDASKLRPVAAPKIPVSATERHNPD